MTEKRQSVVSSTSDPALQAGRESAYHLKAKGADSPLDKLFASPGAALLWDNNVVFHVAQNIVHLRRSRGMTQSALAGLVGTSQADIARLEGGRGNITLRKLERLIKALSGRLRLSIEPEEAKIPHWPDWWEMEGCFEGVPARLHFKAVLRQSDRQGHRIAGCWWAHSDDGIRPAGPENACFYCSASIGEPHGRDCVVVTKLVQLRYTILVDVRVPHAWGESDILFSRNESSWCADSAIKEMRRQAKASGCLCGRFFAEFAEILDGNPHRDVHCNSAPGKDSR